MRIRTIGLAALMAGSLMGDGLAQSLIDEIQDEEQPGSQIEMNIGRGDIEIGRERNMNRRAARRGTGGSFWSG